MKAYAKVNLALVVGPLRADGKHEVLTLLERVDIADDIEVVPGEGLVVDGFPEDTLVRSALEALAAAAGVAADWSVRIEKRIPVAAGLGGGSADAAAVLRLARDPAMGEAGWVPDLAEIAAELGADVPSQLDPVFSLVGGAGEEVEKLPTPTPHAVVLLPSGGGLSTAAVFAEADRLGLGRSGEELDSLATRLREAAAAGGSPLDYVELLANDLEPAARSLRPDIGDALDALRDTDAPLVLLTGSGPTAFGLFPTLTEAKSAAAQIDREDAIVCEAGSAP